MNNTGKRFFKRAICLIAITIGLVGVAWSMNNTEWGEKEDWSFGDVGAQGSSYRVLVHDHENYNKARFINPRGENTTVLLNDLNDAAQYASGDHPKNKYVAQIKKIGNLETLLPVLNSDIVGSEYGSKVMRALSYEIAKIGDDKVYHFLASFQLASTFAEVQSAAPLDQILESFISALEVGVEKELIDRGISRKSPEAIKLYNTLEAAKANLIDSARQMRSLHLDEGDLFADISGVGAGTAAKAVRELNFKYGKED